MSNVTASGLIHLVLHAAIPGGIAWLFFRKYWLKAWLIMLATMLVDLDHLLASPVYDPARCSMGFHPLHQWPAILVYALIVLVRPLRLLGIGLLIHMLLDGLDCLG
ncbi:MAG: DUF6122 family protein [Gammaproteobacteria bacterium]|nr:DUF6122 family protein [Gammaproteobacteria bacterium]